MKMNAYNSRMNKEHDVAVVIAYKQAYFQRVDKLPKLEEFLSEVPDKKEEFISEETKNARLAAALANFSDSLPKLTWDDLA